MRVQPGLRLPRVLPGVLSAHQEEDPEREPYCQSSGGLHQPEFLPTLPKPAHRQRHFVGARQLPRRLRISVRDILIKAFSLFPRVQMPYYISGVQVEHNAVYYKLQSKVGILVMWNGEDSVTVTDSSF